MLGAGIEQAIAIKTAIKLGLKVVAVDGNKDAVGLRYAHVAITADIKNAGLMIEIAQKNKVNGVFAHAVEIPQIVAQIAKKLHLPGIDPIVAENATDKLKRISIFKKKGVLCPDYVVCNSAKESTDVIQQIGLPCVVKPIDSAGSRGVIKINSFNEAKKAYTIAVSYSQTNKVLIEKYIEGHSISTESIIYKNKIITTGFGDRNYGRQDEFAPFFIEDGHSVPSIIKKEEKKRVLKAVEQAINAIGINWGVAKGDIVLTEDKVYVIEMAARTSGGWFATGTVPLATGVDILESLIKMSVGRTVDEKELRPKWHRAACQRYIIPTEEGYFVRMDGLDKARNSQGVKMFTLFNIPSVGQKISKAQNHTERFGQIITQRDYLNDAINLCERAIKKIQIVVTKND